MRALVFGSSIAEGCWATRGGWVQRLIDDVALHHVREGLDATQGDWVMNLGIGGDTVRHVLARVRAETQARRGFSSDDPVLVFAVGANDSMVVDGRALSSPERFRSDLLELCRVAGELTSRILFVGFTAMDPAGETTRRFFDPPRVLRFEMILREVAADAGAEVVNLLDPFQEALDAGADLLVDGVHPNDDGHQLIYQTVKPALARWLSTLGSET